MKNLKLKNKLNYWPYRLIEMFAISTLFLIVREQTDIDKNLVSTFGSSFNERKFLGFYVLIFLVGIFPFLRNFYDEKIAMRQPNKFQYITSNMIEIGKSALCYGFTISFLWYFILGTKTADWHDKRNWIFIGTIFVVQCIGWMLIGVFEMLLYMLIKNIPIAFVVCYFVFILLNLSLYINTSQEAEYYIRLYIVMFHPEIINNIFTILSVALFDMFLSFLLGWFCYYLLKKHDFLDKGVKTYDAKK